jgi:eukaryotic-like serine/threonine-protein kinase
MAHANAPVTDAHVTPASADTRLDSWKEIAAYLKRDIRTVQRWEKLERLPVRRHQHQKRGSAFAYRDELDAWWQNRGHEVDLAAPVIDMAQVPSGDADTTIAEPPSAAFPASATRRRVLDALPWVVACTAVAIAALSFVARGASPRSRPAVERLQLLAPPEQSLTPARGLAMSPDGRRLAFVSHDRTGVPSLWLREIGQLEGRLLPGTEGASWPFWAADGSALGFFADGKLKRTDLATGPPRTICDAPTGRGGSWQGDIILFAPSLNAAVLRVSASGGTPEAVTVLDEITRETAHWWPQLLPDGEHFLFFVQSEKEEVRGTYLGALGSSTRALVSKGDTTAVYSNGRLVFLRDGALVGQRLDVDSATLRGDVLHIGDRVSYDRFYGAANFTVSESGVLVYLAGNWKRSQLTWYDDVGRDLGAVSAPMPAVPAVALSPDGRQVAIQRWDPERQAHAIWIGDLSRGGWSRLTFSSRGEMWPIWSPDARRIAFASSREGGLPTIYQKAADGPDAEGLLVRRATALTPTDWSARYLLFHSVTEGQSRRISAFPTSGSGETISLRETAFDQGNARVSPDQQWLAYESSESGAREVYVDAFPSQGLRHRVSTSGGSQPRWRRDGKALFFVTPERHLMTVSFEGAGTPRLGIPRALFELPIENPTLGYSPSAYDVDPSGHKFLVSRKLPTLPEVLTVVTDWQAAAKH